MNRKTGYAVYILAALLALIGCGGVPKEAGFPTVREQVDKRIGYRVHWSQVLASRASGGTVEDEEIAEAIRELLEKPLTIDAAVQIALLNNRRLQATYETLGIAQAAVAQAGLLSNPVFHGTATFGVSDVEMTRKSGDDNTYTFGVEMDFLSILYAPMRKSVAKSQFEEAKLRVTAAVMDLGLQAREAFYRASADQQALEMFQQVVLATEAGYEFAEQLHEAGHIP